MSKILLSLALLILLPNHVSAKINNSVRDNQKQFGNELKSNQYSEGWAKFSGKNTYQLPVLGWQVEVLFRDGKSISETARPKGKKAKKNLISEEEANVIADILFSKRDRGPYRKLIKNANFISHFFEYGVVSYEMKLDSKRRDHVGIVGVRTVLYSNGDRYQDIKRNAYH